MAAPKPSPLPAVSHAIDELLVIRLPHRRLLRVIARSVLALIAVLSLPWLRTLCSNSVQVSTVSERGVDGLPFELAELLLDLRNERVLGPDGRGVFAGDAPGPLLPLLKEHRIEPLSPGDHRLPIIRNSIDFVIVSEGFSYPDSHFDRILRVGGVVVQTISSDPSKPFKLPKNYMIVFVRRYRSTVVAIKKLAPKQETDNSVDNSRIQAGRRLLGVPKAKWELLDGLEGVLLEPPKKNSNVIEKFRTKTRFLPDLIGEPLERYPRRVLIDVGSKRRTKSGRQFEKWYPKQNLEFEVLKMDVGRKGKDALGVSEMLRRNVREEDFVVMKAEAEVVEEMMKAKVMGLVDELFMECKSQWQDGRRRSSRPYWACLTLYGRVRDEGVAVHQWWS